MCTRFLGAISSSIDNAVDRFARWCVEPRSYDSLRSDTALKVETERKVQCCTKIFWVCFALLIVTAAALYLTHYYGGF